MHKSCRPRYRWDQLIKLAGVRFCQYNCYCLHYICFIDVIGPDIYKIFLDAFNPSENVLPNNLTISDKLDEILGALSNLTVDD